MQQGEPQIPGVYPRLTFTNNSSRWLDVHRNIFSTHSAGGLQLYSVRMKTSKAGQESQVLCTSHEQLPMSLRNLRFKRTLAANCNSNSDKSVTLMKFNVLSSYRQFLVEAIEADSLQEKIERHTDFWVLDTQFEAWVSLVMSLLRTSFNLHM